MIYKLILGLPLFAAAVAGLFGGRLGDKASQFVTTFSVFIAALLSFYVFFAEAGVASAVTPLFSWVAFEGVDLTWSIKIDALTRVMLPVVTGVSFLVHLYSVGYMEEDASKARFFSYLSLFTFMMLSLVTADNFMQLFFGWEGVGLASYLLIGFWYHKSSACSAAIKAFVVNRVADFALVTGLALIYVYVGSLSFDSAFAARETLETSFLAPFGFKISLLTLICSLLFIGATGKSAQFILHVWLPDAMEGPTPVSALIHAATMVTAGVFLLARCTPLFEYAADGLKDAIVFIGAFTALFAATVAITQNDIKRVIAYSTCSQLGYMFFALGAGAAQAAIFHLFTHAFFKAMLFLGAGAVIHAVHHEQDMRHMGGLKAKLPQTFALMLIGTLAITGFGIPGLFGFAGMYSKDAVIEAAYASTVNFGTFAFAIGVLVAFLTSLYSWRLMFLVFAGTPRSEHADHAHEAPAVMSVPVMILGAAAILAGAVFSGQFVGHDAARFWGDAIVNADAHILDNMHHVPFIVKFSPFIASMLGLLGAWFFYGNGAKNAARLKADFTGLYQFLYNKWYIDELYAVIFVRPFKAISGFFAMKTDKGAVDATVEGVPVFLANVAGRSLAPVHAGNLSRYAFAAMFGVALFIVLATIIGI